MRTLPTTMLHLLNPFVPLFSRRLWPHVFALVVTGLIHGAARQEVVTWPTVHDVAAEPSPEIICSTKTMYLVLPGLAGQLVSFVGAIEQAAGGAAGHVVRDIWPTLPIECPRPPAPVFFGG